MDNNPLPKWKQPRDEWKYKLDPGYRVEVDQADLVVAEHRIAELEAKLQSLTDLISDCAVELNLIRSKDCDRVYDPTLRARMCIALSDAMPQAANAQEQKVWEHLEAARQQVRPLIKREAEGEPVTKELLNLRLQMSQAAKEQPKEICNCRYPDFWGGHQACGNCGKPGKTAKEAARGNI